MSIKLNGSNSGSVEIDVPADAGLNTAITFPATSGEVIVSDTSGDVDLGPLTIDGAASDGSVNLDSSGRLLVGTSSASNQNNAGGASAREAKAYIFNANATTTERYSLAINSGSADASGATLNLNKTRATTDTHTVVQSGDFLGDIRFQGSDGTYYVQGARIEARVDGTPGSQDMPGRLVFSTTADGSSSPTGRVTINNAGTLHPNADNSTYLGVGSYRWAAVYAANGTIQTSDQRTKTKVLDASLGSDFIKALRPVSYKWIEGGKRETLEKDENGEALFESVPGKRTHWGFIAQEVKQAVDAAGVDFGGWVLIDKDDPDSQQALRYDQFIAPLTKALQEAIAKIETLEASNTALEARLTALEGGAS